MRRRPPAVALAGLALAGLLASATLRASAQVDPGLPGDPTSTTSSSSSTTSTTAAARSEPSSTTTPQYQTVAPSSAAPPPQTTGGGDAADPAGGAHVIPPDAQALINSVVRSRATNNKKLLDAVRPLEDFGLTEQEADIAGFGRFPVAGPANFGDDWWLPRWVPTFHLHEGTDIFGAMGTPVRSPTEGTLRQVDGPIGGTAVYVTQDDGTYVYMAHLSAYETGQTTGQRVHVGQVVGYLGDSGDAKGGAPHVHFELHPAPTKLVTTGKGKKKVTTLVVTPVKPGTNLEAIDPKPYLDQWLTDAIAAAPDLVNRYAKVRPRVVIRSALPLRPPAPASAFEGPSTASRSALLWMTAANPVAGALALAEQEAALVSPESSGTAAGSRSPRP